MLQLSVVRYGQLLQLSILRTEEKKLLYSKTYASYHLMCSFRNNYLQCALYSVIRTKYAVSPCKTKAPRVAECQGPTLVIYLVRPPGETTLPSEA